jgi:very-short-patch-repair endonuclease
LTSTIRALVTPLLSLTRAPETLQGLPAGPADAGAAPPASGSGEQPTPPAQLTYARMEHLLPSAEQALFVALAQAAPRYLAVFSQVRLTNLIYSTSAEAQQRLDDFDRIQGECVDFVLCDAATSAPRLVVELDEAGQSQPHRKERDAFVDAALASAGLPVLHVPWQPVYDPAALAEQLVAQLGRATQSQAAVPATPEAPAVPAATLPAPATPAVPAAAIAPAVAPPEAPAVPAAAVTPAVAPPEAPAVPAAPAPAATPVAAAPAVVPPAATFPAPLPAEPERPPRVRSRRQAQPPRFTQPSPSPRRRRDADELDALRYACGQCRREVRRDSTSCPHCKAVLVAPT